MTDEVEIPPWERLQLLSEMSAFARPGYAREWANELMDQLGMDVMAGLIWTAYRDTVAAVLLTLVRSQPSVSNHEDVGGADRSDGKANPVSDAQRPKHYSDDVPPPVIRAWAHQRGISIADRGRIPMWITHQYYLERAQEPQKAGIGSAGEKDGLPAFAPGADADAPASKLEDFLQVLHGESHND